MSKNAPDFSGSFKLVQDQLTETEQRLQVRKQELDQNLDPTPFAASSKQDRFDSRISETFPTSPSVLKRNPEENDRVPPTTSINRQPEQRRNLTLKVLESNEAEFNRLFHRLQLAGDSRRKQELADEALQLLFAQYPNQS